MANCNIKQTVSVGGGNVSQTNTYSASAVIDVEEAIPDSSTDLQINIALDTSALKAFYMVSDQAITIETNNGTTPDDTITLVANVPYIWSTDSYDVFLLDTLDWTAIFVTNSSGATANLKIKGVQDATP